MSEANRDKKVFFVVVAVFVVVVKDGKNHFHFH
jgi:hypothetical protein